MKYFFTLLFITLIGSTFLQAQTDKNRESAKLLLEKGEVAEAKKQMEEALNLAPEIAENQYMMGRVMMAMQSSQDALSFFKAADSLKLKSAELSLYTGIAYFLTGNNKKAIESFTAGIALNQHDYLLPYNRALVYVEEDRYDAAMVDLNSTIELKPDFAEAYLTRGKVSFEDEKFKFCIKDCEKALELNPNLADAYYYLALAHGGNGDDKNAILEFDKAIELNPSHDRALNHRGSAKYLSGNKKGACRDWQKAKELGNDEAEANYESYCTNAD